MSRRGNLIVISGPSGVGKTTICNEIIICRSKDIRYSISATSRPKRKNEKNGREYYFLSRKKFKEWIDKGFFIEYAIVHDNYYGTPKKFLEENLKNGYHVLLNVDVQGARELMKKCPEGVFIFITPPDMAELVKRLQKRNTDDEEEIKKRLLTAQKELEYKGDYKYIIENRNLEKTVKEILTIVDKEVSADS